jgi:TonB-linked SusC/RagA family outer membrane protein
LKIRGSYGEVGNDQIGGRRYLYLPSTWGYGGNYAFGGYYFGNTNGGSQDPYYTGATENTVGNPDVTWERARKVNFGMEANFFKNRLSFVGDIFSEKRDNILWALGTIPGTVGANLPPANIGKVSNKGYELQAGWDDKIGDFVYSIKGNVSYARNKIEFMDEPSYPYEWMNTTGFSIGQYKGLKTNGFYNTQEEAANHPYSNIDGNKVQAGDIRYIDISGDGVIDSRDNAPIGYSNLPRYAFGTTLSLDYKGFSLSVVFTGTAQGSILMTDFYMLNPFYHTNGSAMAWQYEGRWTPEKAAAGITPTFPRASLRTYSTQNGVRSDFWLKSTDHIRLKNVEIGYTFSKLGQLQKIGAKGIRLFANANNLYTWSHLIDGFDPEQQDSGGAGSGYLYPMTRIFNFGMNVQF